MRNLARRIKKLESVRVDATGLVPNSEAWFAFWEGKFYGLLNGEDLGGLQIPIEVVDRAMAAARDA